jgi:hypothetical protein
LSASATVILSVGTAPVTGTASVPSGTTVTLTNGLTGQKITLTSGSFSIPSGVGVGVSGPGIDVMFSPLRAPGLALTGPAAAGRRAELRPAKSGSSAQVWHLSNPGHPSVTAIANGKTGIVPGSDRAHLPRPAHRCGLQRVRGSGMDRDAGTERHLAARE